MITKKHPPMFRPRLARPEPEPCPEPRPLWVPKVGDIVTPIKPSPNPESPRQGEEMMVMKVQEMIEGQIDVFVRMCDARRDRDFKHSRIFYCLTELQPVK